MTAEHGSSWIRPRFADLEFGRAVKMDQAQYVSQIADALDELGGDVHVQWSKGDDGGDAVVVSARNYEIRLYIDVARALSLEFTFRGESGGVPVLGYNLDTDLYPIGDPKYERFAHDIGCQIIDFLGALAAGAVRVGTYGRKRAIVVPVGGRTVVIYGGRFTATMRDLSARDQDDLSDLRPVHVARPHAG